MALVSQKLKMDVTRGEKGILMITKWQENTISMLLEHLHMFASKNTNICILNVRFSNLMRLARRSFSLLTAVLTESNKNIIIFKIPLLCLNFAPKFDSNTIILQAMIGCFCLDNAQAVLIVTPCSTFVQNSLLHRGVDFSWTCLW